MTSIGAEVGQKMRSAIKAKLLELNCYVDDELPDYVMVMVANKRTKSQMKEDLQLFLTTKTGVFVDWLHIVLKKLKEVTVTNPDLYKKTAKRKASESTNVNVKKEKKIKKEDKKAVAKVESTEKSVSLFKSLTDDLPISANKLSEQRKIIIMQENKPSNAEIDNFDIPPLSEVNMSTEEELEDIEKKIKTVKSRLGLLIASDEEADCIDLKPDPDELLSPKIQESNSPQKLSPKPATPPPKKTERTRITFSNDETDNSNNSRKRKSVLARLGKRRMDDDENEDRSKNKKNRFTSDSNSTKYKKDRNAASESVLNRLGVMSKVSVPIKSVTEEPEEPFKNREVPSMVKIKPRVIPHDAPQATKNLLLKAVAEAQRSVAQAVSVGNTLKPDALFTKKYKEKQNEEKATVTKKLSAKELNKIKKILNDNNEKKDMEYVPTPINRPGQTEYVPTPKSDDESENGQIKQKFIITLDGLDKTKFKDLPATNDGDKESEPTKVKLDRKKTPSPIIFDKVLSSIKAKPNIPDKLPVVHASASVKNKERCKYWPSCRQGEKCEFVHPINNCDKFPHCKFGDRCLYLHPICKFGTSCTRRECPYSHSSQVSRVPITIPAKPVGATQICKFFPNCTNLNCIFYHPKPCKFGKYCKNQSECNFSHPLHTKQTNLTWKK